MKDAVLDASVVGSWFWYPVEPITAALRSDYESGRLVVHAPTLLFLELLNVAGRQFTWTEEPLRALADRLRRSRFEVVDPALDSIATWVARGLTAYDASYVALAEQLGVPLMTTDRVMLQRAPGVAVVPA